MGLNELRKTVAKDHKLSGWFNHPMPGFKDYQGKIWKWDFKPENDKSATRKGWRLYAWVPDPKAAEPIPAVAFLYYDKNDTPKGGHAKFLAGVLKSFLAAAIQDERTEDRFRHQMNDKGEIVSLCYGCYEIVIISAEAAAVEAAEESHRCSDLAA